jgi:hypothetical protein
MAYGTVKVDNITFTNGGIDQTVTVSGIVQSISGNITATGTIQGQTIIGTSTVSGATVTGDAGQFTTATAATGIFTSQISGATITGNVGSFTTITGGTVTLTSGVFASGTAAAPSVSIGTTDNGLYSPGTDQVAVATNGTGRLFVDASGNVGVGTSSVNALLEVNNSTAGGEVQRIEGNYDGSGSVTLTNWRRAGGSVAAALKYNDDSSPLCMSIGTTTSHEFRIRTADTDAITIDTSQRVGIGTSSPEGKLTVAGPAAEPPSSGTTANSLLQLKSDLTTELNIGLHTVTGNYGAYIQASDNNLAVPYGLHLQPTGGNVGIGTTSPAVNLHVKDSTTGRIRIEGGATYAAQLQFLPDAQTNPWVITCDPSRNLVFFDHASERARIDSSGRLLVGTSSTRTWGGVTGQFLFEGTGFSTSPFFISNSNDQYGCFLTLGKSRGTSVGSNTVVQSGDYLGEISFVGADGSVLRQGAGIAAWVDGTPGANDMPGRLVFSTTSDGASSPTERLRITSAGLVGIGTSTPGANLEVFGDTADVVLTSVTNNNATGANKSLNCGVGGATAFSVPPWPNSGFIDSATTNGLALGSSSSTGSVRLYTGTSREERLRITSAGLVGIGTSAPSYLIDASSGASTGIRYKSTSPYGGIIADNTNTSGGGFFAAFQNGIQKALFGVVGAFDATTNSDAGVFAETGQGIQFFTNGAATTPKAVITSAGLVGIGTTSPGARLQVEGVADAASSTLVITATGVCSAAFACNTTGTVIGTDTGGILFKTGISAPTPTTTGTERARIDSSGRLLVGTSTARTNFYNTTYSSQFQVEGDASATAQISLTSTFAGINGPNLIFGKHRSGSSGGNTIVQNNDELGVLAFMGSDGSEQVAGAYIQAFVDGTPGANDMPGRLVFSTTADGASAPTERMRITSDAYVRLAAGTGGIQFNGDTAAANALDDYEEGTWTPTVIGSTTAGTTTHVNQFGRYTKIGRFVSLHFNVSITSMTGTGNLLVSNIPFQYGDIGSSVFPGAAMTSNLDWPSAGSIVILPTDSSFDLRFFVSSDNAAIQQIAVENSTWEMWCSLSYYVA